MPEIFINGQPVEAAGRPDRDAGGAGERHLHPLLLLAPEAVGARQLPHLHGRGRGRGRRLARDRLQHAGQPRACGSSPTPRRCARGARQTMQLHHAQPPGRLRHLRQGRRVHAAGPPLRVQRRAVDVARPQGARDQVLPAVQAHRARQRALHPVHALRALHARGVEVERAGRAEPRRPLADPAGRGRQLRARRVLGQRHRHLPGRRAAVALVPATRRASGTSSRRRRSARAASAAAPSTSGTASPNGSCTRSTRRRTTRDRPRHAAARIPPSTARGSATRGATWRRSSGARAPTRPMLKGRPVDMPAAIANARAADRRGAAPGRAGVELGLATRSSPRSRPRSADAFDVARQGRLAAGSPARRSRTTC